MDIGRLEIEVFMSLMVMVIIVMLMFLMSGMIVSRSTMRMIPLMSEYESTDNIDDKTSYSNNKGNIVIYAQREKESLDRKSSNKKSHNTQQNSTRIGSEYLYLPSPECELSILSMFTSKYIGK